jgi:hypothetical protein
VTLAGSLVARLADCTVPGILERHDIRPDQLAHDDRTVTQAIARRLHDAGRRTGEPAGIRWWSALTGAWHTTVVFCDRERGGEVAFGEPRIVSDTDAMLLRTVAVLGIRMPRRRD